MFQEIFEFKLTRFTSVAEYYTEFNALANGTKCVSNDALLDCFIGGLNTDIRRDVKAMAPVTMTRVVALAKLYEEKYTTQPSPMTPNDELLELPTDIEPELASLLHTYIVVFPTPTGLPPDRPQNHAIPLIDGTKPVEYLGNKVSGPGVAMDALKVQAVIEWSTPSNIKQLRGFIVLTGYYMRFIKGYGNVAGPLIDLVKKDAFKWSDEAEQAFKKLKLAITSAPILALPNFKEPFTLEEQNVNEEYLAYHLFQIQIRHQNHN
ncbi:hypothetical protein KIW84_040642 [Lathyrus oleraceus]|uniref:Reverse transcriptase/retrotransposon-derived protein RNase H-like domain-containing protein n=1 Tax=Pisum sativum TaxID=3888 RepID=A0A9D4X816_PEA|nr:hypothetical protein KIW84_040642 [Pisum sativum]